MCFKNLLEALFELKEKPMERAIGIDISYWQETFTNKGNIDFIFARTSNGTREDKRYKSYLSEVKKTERRGVYHYYRTNHTEHPMEEQADLVLELIAGHGMKMFASDYEVSDYDDNVLNQESAIQLYGFMLYMLQEEPDIKHLLYTGIYTWRDVLLPLQGKDTEFGVIDWFIFGIWLPRYGWNDDTYILEINGIPILSTYDIWQASATGNERGDEFGVGSKSVDYNEFNGTPDEMDERFLLETAVSPIGENDCEELIAEYEQKLTDLKAVHVEDIYELKKTHALVLNASVKKAHNDALKSLINPLLK